MVGQQVGNFRIIEKLGEGGMGVVYKGMDVDLDRVVAIKMLSPDLSRNPDIVERFRTEARAQANLNHVNLATLYAFLVHDGNAFIAMEFVEGENFEQLIRRRGPLPAEDAVPWFKQALLGVGAAHRMGIVHRDIKPTNLMLNRQGIVKVMDFGIAKVVGARGTTRTGMQLGTPAYMSPEQIQGRAIDVRTDIYALGITLYQMLSGHVPFEEGSDFDIMRHQVSTPPPMMIDLHPYAPVQYQNVVTKAIAKNPEDRYRSVEEFGAALEHPESVATALPTTLAATTVDAPRRTVMETSAGSTYATAAAAAPTQVPAPSHVMTTPASPVAASASGGKWNSRYMVAGLIVLVAAVLLGVVLFARRPSAAPISSVGGSANASLPQPQVEMTGSGTLPSAPGLAGEGNGSGGSGQQASDRTQDNIQQSPNKGKTKTIASNGTPQQGGTAEPPPAPPAPAVDPKLLRDLETENDQLDSRAAAVEASLETLEHQMQQSGLGLRGDMVAARNSMRVDLQRSKQAIDSQDTEGARHYLDLAHRDVEKLEGFLGRR
jgi:serine/threonine-protein kinase